MHHDYIKDIKIFVDIKKILRLKKFKKFIKNEKQRIIQKRHNNTMIDC